MVNKSVKTDLACFDARYGRAAPAFHRRPPRDRHHGKVAVYCDRRFGRNKSDLAMTVFLWYTMEKLEASVASR